MKNLDSILRDWNEEIWTMFLRGWVEASWCVVFEEFVGPAYTPSGDSDKNFISPVIWTLIIAFVKIIKCKLLGHLVKYKVASLRLVYAPPTRYWWVLFKFKMGDLDGYRTMSSTPSWKAFWSCLQFDQSTPRSIVHFHAGILLFPQMVICPKICVKLNCEGK